eukprot:2023610-Lingulodinium_polyedra.AAC.1
MLELEGAETAGAALCRPTGGGACVQGAAVGAAWSGGRGLHIRGWRSPERPAQAWELGRQPSARALHCAGL